ncbi:CmpA/NrtA family ABC transporter substrate-binding protein [Synechococcus sp. W70.1]|uniref:CmpA/NrtA family ABC transporter substrate-binding protein n=1 Tax=unclassified Synechococcus TaxID=2626047 RepID=UPI0039C238C2
MSKLFNTSSPISRRRFLAGAAALAAGAATAGIPRAQSQSLGQGYWVAQADTPETTRARLGFIALTDAAPLIIAKEKGFFAKYGMKDVEVVKQASWGTTRDNLVLGSAAGGIDGAHILSPMPYLITTGKVTDGKPVPMYILARLNLDGQCISISNQYRDLKIGLDSSPLKAKFAELRAAGKEPKCAMTFPGGTHDMWMRYWLAAGGIDPTRDVSLIVVPPPQMVANMKSRTMEAFCVGEPWNAQLVNQKEGYTALTTGELWNNHPEKAFALRADWVDAHPKATLALLKAILEAQIWCDQMENKEEMCRIISNRRWLGVPVADILGRAKGTFDYGTGKVVENSPHLMKFWRNSASYPFKSHDLWFLTENIRWGYLPADTDTKALVNKVNREDLWREAAKAIGQQAAIPPSTSRGVETFFDGVKFDPENPAAYLEKLAIKKLA